MNSQAALRCFLRVNIEYITTCQLCVARLEYELGERPAEFSESIKDSIDGFGLDIIQLKNEILYVTQNPFYANAANRRIVNDL